jgi:hypothetical protein
MIYPQPDPRVVLILQRAGFFERTRMKSKAGTKIEEFCEDIQIANFPISFGLCRYGHSGAQRSTCVCPQDIQ